MIIQVALFIIMKPEFKVHLAYFKIQLPHHSRVIHTFYDYILFIFYLHYII